MIISFLRANFILIVAATIFNTFAIARAFPVNTSLKENKYHARGDYDRRVDRIFRLAKKQAEKPFFEVKNHAIFFDRNPGLFMFIAELFVRFGATSPVYNQILSVILFNIGLVFCFLWIKYLLDRQSAIIAILFLITTPYLLFHSSSIHQCPYSFFFFNLTLYLFSRYLRSDRDNKWLISACVGYFFVCMSYWMFYVSTFLMLIALQYSKYELDPRTESGKASIRTIAILTIPPILALIVTVAQVAYSQGGIYEGIHRMADIAVARSGDWRIDDARWYPNRVFIKEGAMSNYHNVLMRRIKNAMGFQARLFIEMLIVAVVLAGKNAWQRYRWLLFAIIAGLSWNLLMVQHTFIHNFAAIYGFFLWMLIVAIFYREVYRFSTRIAGRFVAKAILITLLVFFLYYGFNHAYYPRVITYYENISQT
jgi:hypothetical protein